MHAGSSQGNESLFICTTDNPALLAPLRATVGTGKGGQPGKMWADPRERRTHGSRELLRTSSYQTYFSSFFWIFWCYYFFPSSVNLSSAEPSQKHRLSNQTDLAQRAHALSLTTKGITLMKCVRCYFCVTYQEGERKEERGLEGGGQCTRANRAL